MHKRVSVAISCHFLSQNATRSRQHAEKRPKWSPVTPKSRLIVVSCSPAASGCRPSHPTTVTPAITRTGATSCFHAADVAAHTPWGAHHVLYRRRCSPRSVPATVLTTFCAGDGAPGSAPAHPARPGAPCSARRTLLGPAHPARPGAPCSAPARTRRPPLCPGVKTLPQSPDGPPPR